MFTPYKIANWENKIISLYVANIVLNSGALVDIDTSDTVAVGASASVGLSTVRAGSLKLATVATSDSTHARRELGVCLPNVTQYGPSLTDRILYTANAVLTVPFGAAAAVIATTSGDIFGTTEFVGYLPGDSGATGALDITNTSNLGAPVGIYQGRYRLQQSEDEQRARFVGDLSLNGVQVGLFQVL